MTKQTLRTDLCRKYCAYFKPDKNEPLACEGYLVIKRLLAGGRRLSFEGERDMPGNEVVESLVRSLCAACSFAADGCDFAAGTADALPCGGFIFLGRLLESGIISVDDILRMH